jgi:hypothetical protein
MKKKFNIFHLHWKANQKYIEIPSQEGRTTIIKEIEIKAGKEAGKQKEPYALLVGM